MSKCFVGSLPLIINLLATFYTIILNKIIKDHEIVCIICGTWNPFMYLGVWLARPQTVWSWPRNPYGAILALVMYIHPLKCVFNHIKVLLEETPPATPHSNVDVWVTTWPRKRTSCWKRPSHIRTDILLRHALAVMHYNEDTRLPTWGRRLQSFPAWLCPLYQRSPMLFSPRSLTWALVQDLPEGKRQPSLDLQIQTFI